MLVAFILCTAALCFAGPIETMSPAGAQKPAKPLESTGPKESSLRVKAAFADTAREIPEPFAFVMVGSGLIALSIGARLASRTHERRLKNGNRSETWGTGRQQSPN